MYCIFSQVRMLKSEMPRLVSLNIIGDQFRSFSSQNERVAITRLDISEAVKDNNFVPDPRLDQYPYIIIKHTMWVIVQDNNAHETTVLFFPYIKN